MKYIALIKEWFGNLLIRDKAWLEAENRLLRNELEQLKKRLGM